MQQKPTMDNSVAQSLRRMQSGVADVPPPEVVWEWEDVQETVGHLVLQYLESKGFVERVSGSLWCSTDRLAVYLQTTYGVSLTGSAGQETLPIDSLRTPRVRSGTDSLTDERGRLSRDDVREWLSDGTGDDTGTDNSTIDDAQTRLRGFPFTAAGDLVEDPI